jgi:tripeptidyl-peptidase-1
LLTPRNDRELSATFTDMWFFDCLFVFLFFALSSTAPTSDVFIQHEKRGAAPSHWIKRSTAPPDARLAVRVGLKQQNAHLGHDHLLDVSNPESPNFGNYWTGKQIEQFFSPQEHTVDSVRTWLHDAGIDQSRHIMAHGRGSLLFHATVMEIEALLNTKYYLYQNKETDEFSVSCDEYSVHHSVRDHVDFIAPTIGFPAPKRHKGSSVLKSKLARRNTDWSVLSNTSSQSLDNCSTSVTPNCIKGNTISMTIKIVC